METLSGILQVLGIFVVFPALIGFGIIGLSRLAGRRTVSKEQVATGLTCLVDADCPPGYVCRDGVCVPAES